MVRSITSSLISRSISSSPRVKARTRSARVTIPTSRSSLTTGSRLTWRSHMIRAASDTDSYGGIVIAGAVIAFPAVSAAALT
jgi:hypothetical protein